MKDRIEELAALFALMPGWTDRYNYLIELGNTLPPMPVAFKVPENRIACNSQLYFYAYYAEDICHIEAEAATSIPQGLAALLHSLCNGIPRQELRSGLPLLEDFLRQTGLPKNLTITRREALGEMIGKIKKSCQNVLR